MGARLDHLDELQENHDINVTPFIDVMLVLLIIFMVAAPLATVEVAVDLPTANAKAQALPEKPLYLTLAKDLTLSLGATPLSKSDLADALARASKGDKQQRLYLQADRKVDYGELMDLMNHLRTLGYTHISLLGQEAI